LIAEIEYVPAGIAEVVKNKNKAGVILKGDSKSIISKFRTICTIISFAGLSIKICKN